MFLLKALNPIIWFWNFFKYAAHLESHRTCETYQPYDFEKDTKYF